MPNLPDYFTPEEDEKNQLPDYFVPEDQEESDKPGLLSRAIQGEKEALIAAKDFVKNKVVPKVSEPLTEAPTRFAESVAKSVRGDESSPHKNILAAYIEGLGHAVSGFSTPINLAFAGAGEGAALAEKSYPLISSALRAGTRVLSAPVAAEGATNIYKGIKNRDIPQVLSGGLEAGMGVLGLRNHAPAVEESQIRAPKDFQPKSTEIPYRTQGQLPSVKTSPESMTPSIKQPISENATNLDDFIKKNPTAKMSEVEAFVKSLKPQENEKPLPTRSPNLAAEFSQSIEEAPKSTAAKTTEDELYNAAREKFNMGKELPVEEQPKKGFVNPFEKTKTEEAPTTQLEAKNNISIDNTIQAKIEQSIKNYEKENVRGGLRKPGDPNKILIPEIGFTEEDAEDLRSIRTNKIREDAMPKGGDFSEKFLKSFPEFKGDFDHIAGWNEGAVGVKTKSGKHLSIGREDVTGIALPTGRDYNTSSGKRYSQTIMNPDRFDKDGNFIGDSGMSSERKAEYDALNRRIEAAQKPSTLTDKQILAGETTPDKPYNSEYVYTDPNTGEDQFNVTGGPEKGYRGSTKGRSSLEKLNIPVGEVPKSQALEAWKPPEYFKASGEFKGAIEETPKNPIDELTYANYKSNRTSNPDVAPERWKSIFGDKVDTMEERLKNESNTIDVKPEEKSKVLTGEVFNKVPEKPVDPRARYMEYHNQEYDAGRKPLKFEEWYKNEPFYGKSEEAPKEIKNVTPTEDDTIELHAGLKPPKKKYSKSQGPTGPVLDKLFNALGQARESIVKQEVINKQERARRFAAYAGIKGGGVKGAAQRLSQLRGEFEKVNPGERLQLDETESGSLFNAIDSAKITTGEKIRGTTALFKILNGEKIPPRNELAILENVFGNGFASRIIELHGGLGTVSMLKLGKLANTMKTMRYMGDLSFPLRQGAGFAHTPEWRNAVKEQLTYLAKPEYFKEQMKAIEDSPEFIFNKEAGLFYAKPGGLMNSEEAFMDSFVGDLKLGAKSLYVKDAVEAAERAYIGGLNRLRHDVMNNLILLAKKTGIKTTETIQMKNKEGKFVLDETGNVKTVTVPSKVAKNISKYINLFTGRGSLGKLEPIADVLNVIFGSPRFRASRLQINPIFNPKLYIDLDPFTRREAVKSLLAMGSVSLTLNSLMALSGATVGYNILNSDFVKSRFKKSSNLLDPNAGMQQPVVAAARMINDVNRMASGQKRKFGERNIGEIGADYILSGESPILNLAHEIATMSQYQGDVKGSSLKTFGIPQFGGFTNKYGDKKYLNTEIIKNFTPIFSEDMYTILNSDPSFAEGVGLSLGSLFGAGSQNYPEKTPKPASSLLLRRMRP